MVSAARNPGEEHLGTLRRVSTSPFTTEVQRTEKTFLALWLCGNRFMVLKLWRSVLASR